MGLRLDYDNEDKLLYLDNILVYGTKDLLHFLSIHISDHNASITRYVVPGRIDEYTFTWVPGGCGLGNRVAYFTDTSWSLEKAVKQIKKDLSKKQVKELLKQAKLKCPRSYLDPLLEALR